MSRKKKTKQISELMNGFAMVGMIGLVLGVAAVGKGDGSRSAGSVLFSPSSQLDHPRKGIFKEQPESAADSSC